MDIIILICALLACIGHLGLGIQKYNGMVPKMRKPPLPPKNLRLQPGVIEYLTPNPEYQKKPIQHLASCNGCGAQVKIINRFGCCDYCSRLHEMADDENKPQVILHTIEPCISKWSVELMKQSILPPNNK